MLQRTLKSLSHPASAIALLLLFTAVRHTLLLAHGEDFIIQFLTNDDSFYYIQTAWNQPIHGFTTFDGINPTNGVQFLWYWMLVALRMFFAERGAFFIASMFACSAMSLLALLFASLIGRTVARDGKWLLAALPIFLMVNHREFMLMGLENSLHLAVVLAGVWLFLRFLRAPAARLFLLLTLAWTLNGWTRLDSGIISAVIMSAAAIILWCSPGLHRSGKTRTLISASAIVAAGVGILLVGNYLMGGSITPVSGLWKQSVETDHGPFTVFVNIWARGLFPVLPLEDMLPEEIIRILGAIVLPVAIALGWWRRRDLTPAWRRFLLMLTILGAACLLHHIVLAARLRDFAEKAIWYQTPFFAANALAVAFLFEMIRIAIVSRLTLPRWAQIRGPLQVAGVLVMGLGIAWDNANYLRSCYREDDDGYYPTRVRLAENLSVTLPPDARLAAYNSGQLGFFSERSTTNLDGLINSYHYYRFRMDGGSIVDYLRDSRIDYIIDYKVRDEVLAIGKLERVIEVDDERPILVVRLPFGTMFGPRGTNPPPGS